MNVYSAMASFQKNVDFYRQRNIADWYSAGVKLTLQC